MKQRSIIAIAISIATLIIAVALYFTFDSSSITIEGRIVGAQSNTIYLERHDGIKQNSVDSLELAPRGEFRFKITDAPSDPTLYELHCGDEKIPLLAQKGDRIEVNSLGNISLNYTVKGSSESELLRSFYQPYLVKAAKLKKLASAYAIKQHNGDNMEEISISYNNLYKDIKQEQLRFIITNKESIASIYALMQLLPGDQHLVNESSDLIYQRAIAEAVEKSYPNSPYLNFLKLIIKATEVQIELLSNISTVNYPDIEMSDRFGELKKLSSLNGDVILLDFWSPEMSESNLNNAELKQIYTKYSDQGFEIYQVGIISSKSDWINAVQTQRLPWVTVSDLRGESSPALRLYNVSTLPFNILISSEGDIVGRNLFSEQLDQAISREISARQNK